MTDPAGHVAGYMTDLGIHDHVRIEEIPLLPDCIVRNCREWCNGNVADLVEGYYDTLRPHVAEGGFVGSGVMAMLPT